MSLTLTLPAPDLRRVLHNALVFSSRKNAGGGLVMLRLTVNDYGLPGFARMALDAYGFDDVVAVRDRAQAEVVTFDDWFTAQRELYLSVAELGGRTEPLSNEVLWNGEITVQIDPLEKRLILHFEEATARYPLHTPQDPSVWSLAQDLLEPGRKWQPANAPVALSPTRLSKLNRLEPKQLPVVMYHAEPAEPFAVWTYGQTVTGLFEYIDEDFSRFTVAEESDWTVN